MKTNITSTLLTVALLTGAAPALAEIVVIVSPENPATRMFGEQAAQFFLGKSSLFTPIEYKDGTPIRTEFYDKVLQKNPAQVKSIWTKLVFTGKGTAPKEYGSAAEVRSAVAKDPKAIGYIDKSAVDSTVKVIFTVQ